MQSLLPNNERLQWKTTLWLGDDSREEVLFTGASLSSLKDTVAQWLRSNEPMYISNEPSRSLVPFRRRLYAFCARPQRADEVFLHLKQPQYRGYGFHHEDLAIGWHCAYFMRESPHRQNYRPAIRAIDDKEALVTQLQSDLVFSCGPDYVDPLLDNGRVILERVMTVVRAEEIAEVNDMLRRGWRLISLEMNGSENDMGQIVSQSATFVLGHPEVDAI